MSNKILSHLRRPAQAEKPSEQILQRAAISTNDVDEVPEIVYDVLRSLGQPLDAQTRAFMEPRFGQDFSHVRVHTDSRAAESAAAVNAHAYTVGRDMAFGEGEYAPRTSGGKRLIAHELTHVVQQSRGIHLKGSISEVGDGYEQNADAVAEQLIHSPEDADLPVIPLRDIGALREIHNSEVALQRDKKKDRRGKKPSPSSLDLPCEKCVEVYAKAILKDNVSNDDTDNVKEDRKKRVIDHAEGEMKKKNPEKTVVKKIESDRVMLEDDKPGPINVVKGKGISKSEPVQDDLRCLLTAASAANVKIGSQTTFRDLESQWRVWHDNDHPVTRNFVAIPGTSNHGTGKAIDFSGDLNWLLDNAGKYGWVNLPTENWHYDHISTPGIINNHRRVANRKKMPDRKENIPAVPVKIIEFTPEVITIEVQGERIEAKVVNGKITVPVEIKDQFKTIKVDKEIKVKDIKNKKLYQITQVKHKLTDEKKKALNKQYDAAAEYMNSSGKVGRASPKKMSIKSGGGGTLKGDINVKEFRSIDYTKLNDQELEQEINLVRRRLMSSKTYPERSADETYLKELENCVFRRQQITVNNQTKYKQKTFQFIKSIAPLIKSVSSKKQVPALAIAGAIADEYDARKLIDSIQDAVIDSLSESDINLDRFFDFPAKLLNVLENDIGPANIKVKTALELVKRGELDVPGSPPSNIQVNRIIDFLLTERGIVEATAAVINRAQSLFGPYMGQYTPELREAVLIEYFKQGEDKYYKPFMDKRKSDPDRQPFPGDDGKQFMFNRSQLQDFLD